MSTVYIRMIDYTPGLFSFCLNWSDVFYSRAQKYFASEVITHGDIKMFILLLLLLFLILYLTP